MLQMSQALIDVTTYNKVLRSWAVNGNTLTSEFGPFVAELYMAKHMPDSAYYTLQRSVAFRDSLFNLEKVRQFQSLSFNETLRQQQQLQDLKLAEQRYSSRLRTYALLAGLVVVLGGAFFLYRNNRQKQKANAFLSAQKQELEEALTKLKSTQTQLVQSEKMASLGELTAGIAHEIQNPLNFVNNFSEVNTELIAEMKLELQAGRYEQAIAVAADLEKNLEKIAQHGKRADSIVKGMLLHSRVSSGQKEPTDLNAMLDEYLKLSYHGMRAKDKSFNVTLQTHYDPAVGMVNVIPQEMGRVMLNIYNNALYALNEKSRREGNGYAPTIEVRSKRDGQQIIVEVKDNADGIPDKIREKIFQPFFTTKPTGSGTGLGLSLSYDIIKAHGGKIDVSSTSAQGSTFTIHFQNTNAGEK